MKNRSKPAMSMHVESIGEPIHPTYTPREQEKKPQFQNNLMISKIHKISAEQACLYLQLKDEGCKKLKAIHYCQSEKSCKDSAKIVFGQNENKLGSANSQLAPIQKKSPPIDEMMPNQEVNERYSNKIKNIIEGNKIDLQIDQNLEKQKVKQQSELKRKLECMDEYMKNLDKEFNYTNISRQALKDKLFTLHQNMLIRNNQPTKYLKMNNIKFFNIMDQVLIKNSKEKNLLKKFNAFPPLVIYDKQKMEIKEKVNDQQERRPDDHRNSQTFSNWDEQYSATSLKKIQIFQDSQILLKQLNGEHPNESSIKPQSPITIQQFNQSNYLFPRRDSANSVDLNQQQQLQMQLQQPVLQRRNSFKKTVYRNSINKDQDSPFSIRGNSQRKTLINPISCSPNRSGDQEVDQQGDQDIQNHVVFNQDQQYDPQSPTKRIKRSMPSLDESPYSSTKSPTNNNNSPVPQLTFQDQLTEYIKQQINKINDLKKLKSRQNLQKTIDSQNLENIKNQYEEAISKEFNKIKPNCKLANSNTSKNKSFKNDYNSTYEYTSFLQFARNSNCSFYQPQSFSKQKKILVNN